MQALFKLILGLFSNVRTRSKPQPSLSADGAWLMGLDIAHRNQDAHLPFGRSATRKQRAFQAIVAHHPAVPRSWSAEDTVQLINNPRRDGHMYGYTFVIDVDGTIIQCAPLTKRTNHVKSSRNRRKTGRDIKNTNALGICFQHADLNPDMAPTQAQMQAGICLHKALETVYRRELVIYGHGQLQTDRHKNEGLAFASYPEQPD